MPHLPKEILDIKQWSHSFSLKELKRPRHSHYTPIGSMSYVQAKRAAMEMSSACLIGFYVTDSDPFILGDIDHLSDPMDADAVR